MIKRIEKISELKEVLVALKNNKNLGKITEKQKHIAGDWNIDHLIEQMTLLLLTFKSNAVFVCYFKDEKPASFFAGLISEDWSCGKKGLSEIVWLSVESTMFGGVRVLQEVEKIILEKNIDFLSINYMCNGGDPRIQGFYMNNGFRLDTLNFVKNYK